MANNKVKFAFGTLENVDAAISSGKIDNYDVLLLKDANDKAHIGWIDKSGNKVLVEEDEKVVRVNELPTADGDENVIYIYDNEAYIWDGTECVSISKSADLSALETEIASKVDEAKVQEMIEASAEAAIEIIEF